MFVISSKNILSFAVKQNEFNDDALPNTGTHFPPFFYCFVCKMRKILSTAFDRGSLLNSFYFRSLFKNQDKKKKCFDVSIESFYWKLGKGPSINDVRPFFRFYYPLPSNQWFFWTYLKFFFHLKQAWSKGQYTSKCCFGVFNFSQKTNENMSTWGIIVVKSNLIERNEK